MTFDERLTAIERAHAELAAGYAELLARMERADHLEANAAAALDARLGELRQMAGEVAPVRLPSAGEGD